MLADSPALAPRGDISTAPSCRNRKEKRRTSRSTNASLAADVHAPQPHPAHRTAGFPRPERRDAIVTERGPSAPRTTKKTVAEQLELRRAGSRIWGRYDLWSALRDIELTKQFIVESLDTIEEKENESAANQVLNNVLPEHLPIMIVAAMESFFRSAIAELIDHGEPFAARAVDLIEPSNQKPDYLIFLAVQKKKFTIGQFISHLVPLNSVEPINAAFTTLLAEDFLKLLKKEELTSKLWDSHGLTIRRIGDDPGPIFSSVKRIVEIRNSIAHETSPIGRATVEEIVNCCDRTKIFLIGAETFLFRLLHPGEPEFPNNLESKEYAHRRVLKAEATLAKLLVEYKDHLTRHSDWYLEGYLEQRLSEIDDFQKRWREFAELKAKFAANEYAGGTIWGLIYSRDLEASILSRIQELREALNR